MVDSDWVKRARQGDVDAIAQLINQSLQTDGVSASAQRNDQHLKILLESAIPLDRDTVLPRIHQGMIRLAIPGLYEVSIYSKRTDSEFPDWSATVALPEEPTTESAIADASNPSASSLSSVEPSGLIVPSEERLFALLAHLGPLLGSLLWLGNDSFLLFWGTGSVGLIGRLAFPLVILFTKGKDSPFVKAQAKEALNFQISMLICWMVVGALFVILIGFLLVIPLALFELVCMILAAVKAGDRQLFRYPLNLRLIK